MIRPQLRWPTNARFVRTVEAFGDPLMEGVVGAIDRNNARGMDGRTGTVRIGEPDIHRRYDGYLAVAATPDLLGASATTRRSPNTALPSTNVGQVTGGNQVMNLLGDTAGASAR